MTKEMKLESQVVSLELAQKLKELGVKQESLFYYREAYHTRGWRDEETGEWLQEGVWEGDYDSPHYYPKPRFTTADVQLDPTFVKWNQADLSRLDETEVSAFTVAELGEMLPCYNFEYPYSFKMSSEKEWSACWIDAKTQRIIHQVVADTEADARAKMLVYLLENKHIIP